jgi:ABC-type antimicrobial peptide transport system permease subunit
LSAYTRLTNFALLRALGITSGQVASMLTCEQATVYVAGLLLGGGFGALLAISVIPALTFTNLNSSLSDTQFFALQSLLATQLVVPASLLVMLLILVGIYAIALALIVRVTTRSALGQSLRLSED